MSSRVLILEDDPLIAAHLETLVDETSGSAVMHSTSIADATAALASSISFALLDVDVLDGKTYDFAAELYERDIPFAFVSASDRGEVPRGLRHVPFVAKPYCPEDIVAILPTGSRER